MTKPNILAIVLSLIGLIVSLIGIPVYFTQPITIRIIGLRDFYSNADRYWRSERFVLYLLVSFISCITALRHSRKYNVNLNAKYLGWIMLTLVLGLFLGLVVHYASSCCDTPVVFHFGFPFSWLLGVTGAQHYLPTIETCYLVQNIKSFRWLVIYWNFFANIFFWFNIGFLFLFIREIRRVHSGKTRY
jgi:hypothetical protein